MHFLVLYDGFKGVNLRFGGVEKRYYFEILIDYLNACQVGLKEKGIEG